MLSVLVISALAATANAHIASWNKGMFCRGGNATTDDEQNTNLAVNPLYQLDQNTWWMQADRGCNNAPPPAGEFLELPARGQFQTELATNRAFTTLSYDGNLTTEWQDGKNHSNSWIGVGSPPGCLKDNPENDGGELHCRGQYHAAGTAWAISYESDLSKVTMENLVVFSVRHHTPWKRLTTYDVPDLPECPEEGCYCAWLWIPDGCGQPNMYMQNHRCKVTNSKSTKKLGTPKPPVWCEDDLSKCLAGPKQMMAWNQAGGNNVEAPENRTPTYNQRMGFFDGAQDDIFADDESISQTATGYYTDIPTVWSAAQSPTPSPATSPVHVETLYSGISSVSVQSQAPSEGQPTSEYTAQVQTQTQTRPSYSKPSKGCHRHKHNQRRHAHGRA